MHNEGWDDYRFTANSPLSLSVKEFWKSVNIWPSMLWTKVQWRLFWTRRQKFRGTLRSVKPSFGEACASVPEWFCRLCVSGLTKTTIQHIVSRLSSKTDQLASMALLRFTKAHCAK